MACVSIPDSHIMMRLIYNQFSFQTGEVNIESWLVNHEGINYCLDSSLVVIHSNAI